MIPIVAAGTGINPVVAMIITLILLLLNAVFVAVEFALIAARRTRIEALVADGNRQARMVLAGMQNLPLNLSGAQLGITVTSLGLGLVTEPAVAGVLESFLEPVGLPSGLLHALSFAVALTFVVFLHMVIGEMVPKNLALAVPERTTLWVVPLHRVFLTLFRPIVWLLNVMAAWMLKPFRVEQVDEIGTAHTAQELVTMIDASKGEGLIDESSHNLLSGALDFAAHEVAALMVPWEQVIKADRGAALAEVGQLAVTSGHTRLPIVSGDTVFGFVHAKDLLYADDVARDQPVRRDLIRRMLVVPPTRQVSELLFSMRRSQIHVALVRDESGPLGIVTLEDILESIVGDIIDETDRIRGVERVR